MVRAATHCALVELDKSGQLTIQKSCARTSKLSRAVTTPYAYPLLKQGGPGNSVTHVHIPDICMN